MKPYFLEYACPTGTAATYSTPAPSQRNPDFKPTIHRWLGMQLKGWYGTLWYMYGMVCQSMVGYGMVWYGMVWYGGGVMVRRRISRWWLHSPVATCRL